MVESFDTTLRSSRVRLDARVCLMVRQDAPYSITEPGKSGGRLPGEDHDLAGVATE